MKGYSLILITAVAFLFSAASLGVTVSQGKNITELEGGLFAAVVAIIILVIRLYQVEKRLSKLENPSQQDDDRDNDGK